MPGECAKFCAWTECKDGHLQQESHMAGFCDAMEDVDALPQQAIHIVLVSSLEQLYYLSMHTGF